MDCTRWRLEPVDRLDVDDRVLLGVDSFRDDDPLFLSLRLTDDGETKAGSVPPDVAMLDLRLDSDFCLRIRNLLEDLRLPEADDLTDLTSGSPLALASSSA